MLYKDITKKYTDASHNINKTAQVVMLYEGMIRYIKNAKNALNHSDYEAVYNNITKTQNIIHGLQMSLDYQNAEDMSKILDRFYKSIFFRLSFLTNQEPEERPAYLEGIIKELNTMCNAWRDLDKQYLQAAEDHDAPENDSDNNLNKDI